MRNPLTCLVGLIFFVGFFWVIYGRTPPDLWVRGIIYVSTLLTLTIVLATIAFFQRAARLARNAEHSQQRGYRYREEAPLAEFLSAENCFPDDARIESVAQGERKGSPFAVFDLSWQETTHHGEGGTSTITVSQSVVLLPGQVPKGVSLPVIPLPGLDYHVLSFLGLTGTITANRKAPLDDTDLLRWFEQNYHVAWDDDVRTHAENMLQLPVLRWLQDHPGTAFEMAGGQLVLWRPHMILDAEGREELVDDALDLAAILSAATSEKDDASSLPAFRIQPPAVASLEGVFWRMVVSAFGSWLIASVSGIGLFFLGVTTGLAQALGAAPFVVIMMTLVITIWLISGFGIHYWISLPASETETK